MERDMGMLRGVCVPVAWSVGLWSVGLVASERCVVGRALHVCVGCRHGWQACRVTVRSRRRRRRT